MADVKIVARPWQPQDLIDELQEMIDEESDNYINTRRTTLCMAKSFLEEHFAEPKWIPVTERLPEHFGQFSVTVTELDGRRYADFANFDPYTRQWKTSLFRGYGDKVTHWMPLPEPPKGE